MLCFKRSTPGVNLNLSTSTSRFQIGPAITMCPAHKQKILRHEVCVQMRHLEEAHNKEEWNIDNNNIHT